MRLEHQVQLLTRKSSVNEVPACVSKAKICDRDRSAVPPDEEISDQPSRHENFGRERIRFDLFGRPAPDFGAFAPDQGQIAVIDQVRVEKVVTHLVEGVYRRQARGTSRQSRSGPARDRGSPPFGDRRADAVRSLG